MIDERLANLIIAAQNNDSAAINELFAEIYNDVYYFAKKTVKDETLAEDITQEALIDIFKNIKSLNDPVAFPAWSKQITYHRCTAHFRKKQDVLVEENEDGSSIFDTLKEEKTDFIPDAALDQKDFSKTILEFIDTLSEEQRSAVLMYYFDEMSISDIAAVQGVSEGTVKSRLNYARKGIKAQVEDYEEKSGIKLHSVALLPLIRWIFAPEKASSFMSPVAAQNAANAVGHAVYGATTATAAGAATSAATSATATSAAAAGATVAAKAGMSLLTKLIIGITATAVVAGGTAAVVISNDSGEDGDSSYTEYVEGTDGDKKLDKQPVTDREGAHITYTYDLSQCYGKLSSESFQIGQIEGSLVLDETQSGLTASSYNAVLRDHLCDCFKKGLNEVGQITDGGASFKCACGQSEWTAQKYIKHSFTVKDGERQDQHTEKVDSATTANKEPYAYVINNMSGAYGTINGVAFSKLEYMGVGIELGMYADGSAVAVKVTPEDLELCSCFHESIASGEQRERQIVGTLNADGTEFTCKCGKTHWTNSNAVFMKVQDIYETGQFLEDSFN